MYIRPIFANRNIQGELKLAEELADDPQYHYRYFRMNKASFDIILEKSAHLRHGGNHLRPISILDKVAMTLRYLATGSSQSTIAFNFRVSPCSVGKIVKEVMESICLEFEDYLSEPDQARWEEINAGFKRKWNFPMWCGAIDGKHIRIRAPPYSGSQHCNYKGFFSIVLLAVADCNYKFTLVDIGSSGSNSDGGVLKSSPMGTKLESGGYKFPPSYLLPTGNYVPSVIFRDDAFPLKTYLMKPYPGKTNEFNHNVFNYRLSRARMVVENAFGILAARWRIFYSHIEGSEEHARLINKTTIILHNYLQGQGDTNGITGDREENRVVINGNWRTTNEGSQNMNDLPQQGSNNATLEAFSIQDALKDYFLTDVGSVPWQTSYVMRGYE